MVTQARGPIIQTVTQQCAALGLDVVSPLALDWYNDAVGAQYRLPDLGREGALTLLIGNTRRLWQPLVAALADDDDLFSSTHPIDRYVVRGLSDIANRLGHPYELRFAHEPPPRRVAVQAMAEVAGLAVRTPTHQSVHPIYGPWLAFRAALVLPVEGPTRQPKRPCKPCGDCSAHCEPAFAQAVRVTARDGEASTPLPGDWKYWLAVRDACPAGRDWRYGEDQIRYHYTKDLSALRALARPHRDA